MSNVVSVSDVFPVSAIKNHEEKSINGRTLWEYLGKNMSHYERDVKQAIEDAMLVLGEDYEIVKPNDDNYYSRQFGENKGNQQVTAGRKPNLYMFTADSGKDVAMMSSTSKGKEIRAYFKSCENIVIEMVKDSYLIEDPVERAKRWIDEQEEKRRIELEVVEQKAIADEAIRTKSQISDRKTATAMSTASTAVRKVTKIEIELNEVKGVLEETKEELALVRHESENYMTVVVAEKRLKFSFGTINWRDVMRYCRTHNLEVKKVPDMRFGEVNAYPKVAFEEVYQMIMD